MTGGTIQGPMSWQEYAVLGVEVTLNIDKARRELGYDPTVEIHEGVRRSLIWYRDNQIAEDA